MPRGPLLRRRAPIALVAALAVLALAPAAHAAMTCTTVTTSSHPFARWNDANSYVLSPGGNFEAGFLAWALPAPTAPAPGNESFFVGSLSDTRGLPLRSYVPVTSAPICIGLDYPSFRFFLRNTGAPTGRLKVEVLGAGLVGAIRVLLSSSLTGSAAWSPSPPMLILDNLSALLSLNGKTPISLRFTATGGDWQIDDVYVDPYRRG